MAKRKIEKGTPKMTTTEAAHGKDEGAEGLQGSEGAQGPEGLEEGVLDPSAAPAELEIPAAEGLASECAAGHVFEAGGLYFLVTECAVDGVWYTFSAEVAALGKLPLPELRKISQFKTFEAWPADWVFYGDCSHLWKKAE